MQKIVQTSKSAFMTENVKNDHSTCEMQGMPLAISKVFAKIVKAEPLLVVHVTPVTKVRKMDLFVRGTFRDYEDH